MKKNLLQKIKIDHLAWVIAILFFLKAITLAFFITPLWDIPDETGHFAYARNIGSGNELPLLGEAKIDTDILSDVYQKPVSEPSGNWIAQHPPVFYMMAGFIWRMASIFTSNPAILFRITRVVAAFFGAATLMVIYRLFRLLKVKPSISLAIMTAVSFIPMYSHLSSGTNHDTTLTFFSSLSIYHWVSFILDKNIKNAYKSSFWISLAAATKMTALVILAPMVIIVCLELDSPWKKRIKEIILILLISLFLPGLWMLRHYLVFNDPFATALTISHPRLDEPLRDTYLDYFSKLPVYEHYFTNFFGLFGWIGTGKGNLMWLQITAYPLKFYTLTSLILLLTTSYLIIKWAVNRTSEKNVKTSYESGSIVSWLKNRVVKRVSLTNISSLIIVISFILTVFLSFNLYFKPGITYLIHNINFMLIIFIFLLSSLLWLTVLSKKWLLVIYSLIIFGFYSLVVTFQTYQLYLTDGRLRATHGRYFYPLLAFILIGLLYPITNLIKKKYKLFLLIGILFCLLEFLTFTNQVFPFYKVDNVLISSPKFINNKSAGEIIKGTELNQQINIDQNILENIDESIEADNVVCVSLLFGNYNNRDNRGLIKVSFTNKKVGGSKLIDVSKIKDNSYKNICFNDIKISNLDTGTYLLTIEGVDSLPGQAITVWLTEDLIHPAVNINDKLIEKNLMLKILVEKNEVKSNLVYISFISVYCLSAATLFIAFFISDR